MAGIRVFDARMADCWQASGLRQVFRATAKLSCATGQRRFIRKLLKMRLDDRFKSLFCCHAATHQLADFL